MSVCGYFSDAGSLLEVTVSIFTSPPYLRCPISTHSVVKHSNKGGVLIQHFWVVYLLKEAEIDV